MGPDHFDANVMPHNHFICRNCGNILDLNMKNIDHITEMAEENFDGVIEDYVTYFYGTCPDCLERDFSNKKTG